MQRNGRRNNGNKYQNGNAEPLVERGPGSKLRFHSAN